MNCVSCGRAILKKPAVTIASRKGPRFMGPKCALKAGLIERKRRTKLASTSPIQKDQAQVDWVTELEQHQVDLL